MDFAVGMRAHLVALPEKGLMEWHAIRLLDSPDSPHRTRFIKRWESAVRKAGGYETIIDWSFLSDIDWVKVLKIALLILSAFVMFMGTDPDLQGLNAPSVLQAMEGEGFEAWFPGKQALLAMAPVMLDQIGLPMIREIAKDCPVPFAYEDAVLKTYLLSKLEASQTNT